MIRVHDNKQNLDTPITLTTINCDGMKRYWSADSMDEFHRWWWAEDYGGPDGDDAVVEFIVENSGIKHDMKSLNPTIKVFADIAEKYGFNKEIEVGTINLEIGKGIPEYIED